jgi:hypothetical protein
VAEPRRVLLRNARSHVDSDGHGCPSAPAMQHSVGADVTVAPTVSHELLNRKHKSSSLGGTAPTAASGVKKQHLRELPRLASGPTVHDAGDCFDRGDIAERTSATATKGSPNAADARESVAARGGLREAEAFRTSWGPSLEPRAQ